MKHLFKNLLLIGALLLGFAACSDNDDEPEAPAEVQLLTFGFFAEDNPDVLFKDYEAIVKENAFSIALPKEIDKTSLIARFTVGDNDEVTVNEVVQVSGVTANDFTSPVDYILTEKKTNKKYTVTVSKEAPGVWTLMPKFINDSAMECVLKVNPVDNLPYIAYKMNKDASADEKAAMIVFKNGQWTQVGAAGGFSNGRVTGVDFAFDNAGKPYVVYSDYTNMLSGKATNTTSVRKFDGSAWVKVGESDGITDVKTAKSAIAIKTDNHPIVFNMNELAATLAKRELNISEFNGSAWTTSVSMPGRPATSGANSFTAKRVKNTVYLGVFNYISPANSFSIYKLENNSWSVIADNVRDESASTCNVRDFDMDVDAKGNVFVIIADNGPDQGSIYKPRVMKLDHESKAWSNVGNQIEMNIDQSREFSMAVSPTGIPYVFYRNESNHPTLVYLDSDSKQWTEPQVLAQEEASMLSIDFASDGVGYVCYGNDKDCMIVYQYALPE